MTRLQNTTFAALCRSTNEFDEFLYRFRYYNSLCRPHRQLIFLGILKYQSSLDDSGPQGLYLLFRHENQQIHGSICVFESWFPKTHFLSAHYMQDDWHLKWPVWTFDSHFGIILGPLDEKQYNLCHYIRNRLPV